MIILMVIIMDDDDVGATSISYPMYPSELGGWSGLPRRSRDSGEAAI